MIGRLLIIDYRISKVLDLGVPIIENRKSKIDLTEGSTS